MRLLIVGGGRAAWMFARMARLARVEIASVALRPGSTSAIAELLGADRIELEDVARSGADLVLFAIPDDALPVAWRSIGASLPAAVTVFHPSGALGSDVFVGHETRFSLHPLRSLPAVGDESDISGTHFVFEGTPSTRRSAERLVAAAGGQLRGIDATRKPLYHAAAVFASNYVAALLAVASETLASCGIADADAALAKLARSAIDNWAAGTPRFTGPLARGDLGIVERHIESIDDPERRDLYRALAAALCDSILAEDRERHDLTILRDQLRNRDSS